LRPNPGHCGSTRLILKAAVRSCYNWTPDIGDFADIQDSFAEWQNPPEPVVLAIIDLFAAMTSYIC